MPDREIIVGIISDTHGPLRPEAVAALQGSDLIIHSGDVGKPEVIDALREIAPTFVVRGNIDQAHWAQALPMTELAAVGENRAARDLAARPRDRRLRRGGVRTLARAFHRDARRCAVSQSGQHQPFAFAAEKPVQCAGLRILIDDRSPRCRFANRAGAALSSKCGLVFLNRNAIAAFEDRLAARARSARLFFRPPFGIVGVSHVPIEPARLAAVPEIFVACKPRLAPFQVCHRLTPLV